LWLCVLAVCLAACVAYSQATSFFFAGTDAAVVDDSFDLHSYSLRLVLLILSEPHVPRSSLDTVDYFLEAVRTFDDLQEDASSGTFTISYAKIYTRLCGPDKEIFTGEEVLLLYFLVSNNRNFESYLHSRSNDLDQLMLPLLQTLYRCHEFHDEQAYALLATLLMLTDAPDFCQRMQTLRVPHVTWFDGSRPLDDVSICDVIVVVLLHLIGRNISVIQDEFVHVAAFAVLANTAPHFSGMHSYTAQRIVSVFCQVVRQFMVLKPADVAVWQPGTAVYELGTVVHTMLCLINSSLSNRCVCVYGQQNAPVGQ